MGRKAIYTEEHIDKVRSLINEGYTKKAAIKEAGFSDSSLFYIALKRLKRVEVIDFPVSELSITKDDSSIFM